MNAKAMRSKTMNNLLIKALNGKKTVLIPYVVLVGKVQLLPVSSLQLH